MSGTDGGTFDYTYDAEGNRTSKTHIATGRLMSYTYDHRNRLINVSDFDPADADDDPGQGTDWGWGSFSANGTGVTSFDPGTEHGEVTGSTYITQESSYWDEDLQEWVPYTYSVEVELRAVQAAEGGTIQLYGRFVADGYGPYSFDYWTSDGTASASSDYTAVATTGFSLAGDQWVHFGSVSTSDDALLEGDETLDIHVLSVQSGAVGILTPAIIDNERVLNYSASTTPAPEGDGVLLTITADGPAMFQFWTEDVSAVSGDYGAIYSPYIGYLWAGENEIGRTTITTYVDGVLETRESFRVRVQVEGQPGTEIELEADILDLRPHLSIDYAYHTFNQLVRRTLDADGEGPAAPADQFFAYEGGQIVLQFGGPAAADLSHRYLWNPTAVDQLLADEAVTSLTSEGQVLWPLGDHLGTLRDLATYDEATNTTTIANHRQYNSFGKLTGESNAAVDLLFGYTGKLWDKEAQLQNSLNRIYDPLTGRFLTEDPIGFGGGDTNLYRYVSNSPLLYTDPLGLEGDEPWTSMGGWNPWSWHFLGVRHIAGTVSGYDSAWWESVNLDNVIKAQQREDALKNGDIDGYTNGMRMSPSQAQFCRSAATTNYEVMAAGGPLSMAGSLADDLAALAPEHHIMTNKNNISKAAGGPYTPKFEALAKLRGISLEDAMNKMRLPGHQGPHPAYNEAVFNRLRDATNKLKGDKFNKAFDREMGCIRVETATPGTVLNKLATGK